MRDDNTILFDNYEPMTMSRATVIGWRRMAHRPDCHEVIAEIGDWLDEGWDMLVTFTQYPCPSGPIAVTLEVLPACKRKWVLDGSSSARMRFDTVPFARGQWRSQ